jgi:hypothetical protein
MGARPEPKKGLRPVPPRRPGHGRVEAHVTAEYIGPAVADESVARAGPGGAHVPPVCFPSSNRGWRSQSLGM